MKITLMSTAKGLSYWIASCLVGVLFLVLLDTAFVQLRTSVGIAGDVTEVSVEGIALPIALVISSGAASAVAASFGVSRGLIVLSIPAVLWAFLAWGLATRGFYMYFWDAFDVEARLAFASPVSFVVYAGLPVSASIIGASIRPGLSNKFVSAGMAFIGAFVVAILAVAAYYPVLVGHMANERLWSDRVSAISSEWRDMKTEVQEKDLMLRHLKHGSTEE